MTVDEAWAWPAFTPEEADRVREVLLSNKVNYWTGDQCRAFEQEYSSWIGVRHAIALMNGTVALEAALRALEIGPGDEVIVTPRTFIASVSCVASVGATPKFVDVGRDSQNVSAESIEAAVTPATRAIICVHLAGWPCDMRGISELAAQLDLRIIEDCAQAHGASIGGKPVGTFSDIAAWSFCQDKIMTTGGEGGMVTTDDDTLWDRMWSYKDHGKSWSAIHHPSAGQGFKWVHDSFGTNLRMTEMQAAIGRLQLGRMDEWHAKRLRNAQRIWNCAKEIPGIRAPQPRANIEHAAYKCYVFVEPEALRADWNRDRIRQEINFAGIPCFSGSCPEVYRERAFDGTGWRPQNRFPVATELGETSLMFMVHPTLADEHIERACEVLSAVMRRACH